MPAVHLLNLHGRHAVALDDRPAVPTSSDRLQLHRRGLLLQIQRSGELLPNCRLKRDGSAVGVEALDARRFAPPHCLR